MTYFFPPLPKAEFDEDQMVQWLVHQTIAADKIVGRADAATVIVAGADSVAPGKAHYVADGTADDVEIQAALDDFTTDGELILLEGAYTVSANLTIPDDLHITISSVGATLNFAGKFGFRGGTDDSGLTLRGLTITGGAANLDFIQINGDTFIRGCTFDTLTLRKLVQVNSAVGNVARTLISNSIFRDITIDAGGSDFNELGLMVLGSGDGVFSNNYFVNITKVTTTGSTWYLGFAESGGRMVATGNHIESSTGLTDYFAGAGMVAAHNAVDGVAVDGSHDIDVSDLGDVTITAIASGEILKWNGSAWINNTLAEAGISATGHTHTESDVTDLDHTDVAAIHDDVAGEISALTLVTAVSGDHVLIEDASDSNNKKRVAASDFLGGGSAGGALRAERITSAQTVANNTATVVIFNSVIDEDDADGDITLNTSTGVVTVNNAGWYAVHAGVIWANNSVNQRFFWIAQDGVEVAQIQIPGAGSNTLAVSTIIKCDAADELTAVCQQSSGGDLNVNAGRRTFFAIAKLRS